MDFSKIPIANGKPLPDMTEEEIIERLDYLKSINHLNTNSIRNTFPDKARLERNLKRKYKTINNALSVLGYQRTTKVVTIEEINKQLIAYYNQGYNLSYSTLMDIDSSLASNIRNKTKMSVNEYIIHLNLNTNINFKKRTTENMCQRLKLIEKEFNYLNYNLIKRKDPSIINWLEITYGGYNNGLSELGYEKYLNQDISPRELGFQFESIFKEILEVLEINFEYNKYVQNLRPDFILNNGDIIDTKLSSWTNTIDETIKKYLKISNHITIVYLRGNSHEDIKKYKNNKNVKIISVSYYYPLLNSLGRTDLINKCESIKCQESVTTTRSTSHVDEDIV